MADSPAIIRFAWLKRLAVPVGVLVGAAAATHGWLAWRAAETPPPLPPYPAFVANLPPETAAQRQHGLTVRPRWPLPDDDAERDVLRSFERDWAAVFAAVRQSRHGEPVPDGVDAEAGWRGMQMLSVRLRNSARLMADRGDLPAFFEVARDHHHLGVLAADRAAHAGGASFAAGMLAGPAYSVWSCALAFPAFDDDAAWRAARPIVEALIADLLDDRPARLALRRGFEGERGRLPRYMPEGPLARPLAAAKVRSRTAGPVPPLEGPPPPTGEPASVAGALLDDWTPYDPRLEALFSLRHVETQRRAVAVLLAARLYGLDHGGALPPTLDALAPAYLPAVPADPFTDGRPLAYVREAAVPFVYCVGLDGVDDGGSVARDDGNAGIDVGASPFHKRDFVVPLRPSPVEGVDPWNLLYDGGEAVRSSRGY